MNKIVQDRILQNQSLILYSLLLREKEEVDKGLKIELKDAFEKTKNIIKNFV